MLHSHRHAPGEAVEKIFLQFVMLHDGLNIKAARGKIIVAFAWTRTFATSPMAEGNAGPGLDHFNTLREHGSGPNHPRDKNHRNTAVEALAAEYFKMNAIGRAARLFDELRIGAIHAIVF